jgi:hypothetical protein
LFENVKGGFSWDVFYDILLVNTGRCSYVSMSGSFIDLLLFFVIITDWFSSSCPTWVEINFYDRVLRMFIVL